MDDNIIGYKEENRVIGICCFDYTLFEENNDVGLDRLSMGIHV